MNHNALCFSYHFNTGGSVCGLLSAWDTTTRKLLNNTVNFW